MSYQILFMQPSEQCGSYNHREVMVELNEGDRINLDNMKHGGELPLKWGAHAYCGRLKGPEGLEIECYTNWDCSGVPKQTIRCNGHEQDFWDFHNRVCSFRVKSQI